MININFSVIYINLVPGEKHHKILTCMRHFLLFFFVVAALVYTEMRQVRLLTEIVLAENSACIGSLMSEM